LRDPPNVLTFRIEHILHREVAAWSAADKLRDSFGFEEWRVFVKFAY